MLGAYPLPLVGCLLKLLIIIIIFISSLEYIMMNDQHVYDNLPSLLKFVIFCNGCRYFISMFKWGTRTAVNVVRSLRWRCGRQRRRDHVTENWPIMARGWARAARVSKGACPGVCAQTSTRETSSRLKSNRLLRHLYKFVLPGESLVLVDEWTKRTVKECHWISWVFRAFNAKNLEFSTKFEDCKLVEHE